MSKTRVYELAKEFGVDSKDFIIRIEKLGIAVKSHSSTLSDDDVKRIRREFTLRESAVVEERVKSTVIRRRRVVEEPVAVTEPTEAKEEATVAAVDEIEKPKIPEAVTATPRDDEKREPIKVREEEKERKIDKVPLEIIPPTPAEASIVQTQSSAVLTSEVAEAAPETKKELPKEKIEPRETPAEGAKEAAAEAIAKPSTKAAEQREKEIVPSEEKPEADVDKKLDKKKKRAIEVVVDEVPATKKKAVVKQRVERKTRRVGRNIHEEQQGARRGARKESPVIKMKKTELTTPKAIKRRIKVGDAIRVGDLAKKMGVKANEIIAKLISLGMMVTINQSIDFDVASLVTSDFGYQIEQTGFDYDEVIQHVAPSVGSSCGAGHFVLSARCCRPPLFCPC